MVTFRHSLSAVLVVSFSLPAWASSADAPLAATPRVLLAKGPVAPRTESPPPIVQAEHVSTSYARPITFIAGGATAALAGLIMLAIGAGDLSTPNYGYTTYDPYYGTRYQVGNPNYGTGMVLAVLGLIHLAAGGTLGAIGGVQLSAAIRESRGDRATLLSTSGGTAFTF